MSTGQRIRGMTTPARLSHHAERGTPAGSLKLFLRDVAAIFSALLLLVATAASILFAVAMLLFGHF